MQDKLKENLIQFVNNPYSLIVNLDLGMQYEKKDQLASAISHYLRAAEYGLDENYDNKSYLISESLLHAAECMNKLGGRHYSTKGLILNAISNEPKMPQSYLLLSKVYEQTGEWFECNSVCNIGLAMMQHYIPMIYDNKSKEDTINELLFQKAISNYYVGRTNVARNELLDLSKKITIQDWIRDASLRSLASINPK